MQDQNVLSNHHALNSTFAVVWVISSCCFFYWYAFDISVPGHRQRHLHISNLSWNVQTELLELLYEIGKLIQLASCSSCKSLPQHYPFQNQCHSANQKLLGIHFPPLEVMRMHNIGKPGKTRYCHAMMVIGLSTLSRLYKVYNIISGM